jgi:hypothetical protein
MSNAAYNVAMSRKRGTELGRLRERVEKIIGPVVDWIVEPESVQFRAQRPITLKDIVALSEELGTDAINFNFGDSGEGGYSSQTPSVPGHPGFVQVMFPIPGADIA